MQTAGAPPPTRGPAADGTAPTQQALTRAQSAGRGPNEKEHGTQTRCRQHAPPPAAPPHTAPERRACSPRVGRGGGAGQRPALRPALARPGPPWPALRRVPRRAARGCEVPARGEHGGSKNAALASGGVGEVGEGRSVGLVQCPCPQPDQVGQPSRMKRVEPGWRGPVAGEAPPPSVCPGCHLLWKAKKLFTSVGGRGSSVPLLFCFCFFLF